MESFELRHTYPWPRETVWAALSAPEYAQMRQSFSERADAKVLLEHLSESIEDGIRVRRVRHTLKRELPRMMQRLTGPKMSYVVEEHIHPDTFTVTWTATPEVARGGRAVDRRVDIRGEFRFVDLPGDTPGCERIVKARIHVTIPGFGGRIEQGIAKSLRATNESSAALTRQYLEDRLRPPGSNP